MKLKLRLPLYWSFAMKVTSVRMSDIWVGETEIPSTIWRTDATEAASLCSDLQSLLEMKQTFQRQVWNRVVMVTSPRWYYVEHSLLTFSPKAGFPLASLQLAASSHARNSALLTKKNTPVSIFPGDRSPQTGIRSLLRQASGLTFLFGDSRCGGWISALYDFIGVEEWMFEEDVYGGVHREEVRCLFLVVDILNSILQ